MPSFSGALLLDKVKIFFPLSDYDLKKVVKI